MTKGKPRRARHVTVAIKSIPLDQIEDASTRYLLRLLDQFTLTAKQWAYLFALLDLLDRGRPVNQREVSKAAGVHYVTVSKWRQDPGWVLAHGIVTRVHADLNGRDAMVDYRVQAMAMEGRPAAIEANLRRRGLWNTGPVNDQGVQSPVAAAAAQVNFYNLPKPPSRAEAEARQPPPGSDVIVPAPPLPPMPKPPNG